MSAAGVERGEELDFLRSELCKGAQGYLISRPEKIGSFRSVTSGTSKSIDVEDALLKRA